MCKERKHLRKGWDGDKGKGRARRLRNDGNKGNDRHDCTNRNANDGRIRDSNGGNSGKSRNFNPNSNKNTN